MACYFPSLPIAGFAPVGHTERSARMKRSSYGERDYTFGQAMLTLRTAIGLTQAGLAEFLGVSRKAVGGWESGGSYPKAEHLKQFIALAVTHQPFPPGREAEEIRAFWQAAHQKVLLDERWLQELLGTQRPRLASVPPEPVEQTRSSEQVGPSLLVAHEWIGVTRWMCRASMGARKNWRRLSSGRCRSAAGW